MNIEVEIQTKTNMSKILIVLIIITIIYSCGNSTTIDSNINTNKKIESNYINSISSTNGKFKIDTLIILTNQNLQTLIKDLEKETLIEKKTISEIPNFIKTFIRNLTADNFSIANPDEDWQVTDCVLNENLPNRQLIYFGLGTNIALMTYYSGGIAKMGHILIIKYQDKKMIDFWCGNLRIDSKIKNEIIIYLKENKDKEWGLNTNIIYL